MPRKRCARTPRMMYAHSEAELGCHGAAMGHWGSQALSKACPSQPWLPPPPCKACIQLLQHTVTPSLFGKTDTPTA